MNQDQRKYLIGQIEKSCRDQQENLKAELPIKPSLNNYLVAACLDDSLELTDSETLRSRIKEMVLKFGQSDRLIDEGDDYSYRSRKRDNQPVNKISLEAEHIFIFPKAYEIALKEYEKKKSEIEKKVELLEAQKNTLVMKVQIGSNTALDKLVLEVDNLGDLSLMNKQFLQLS